MRALLVVMAIFLGLNTLTRVRIVVLYGPVPGIARPLGLALLAIAGGFCLLACLAGFFLLAVPERRSWWAGVLSPALFFLNVAVAIAVLPEEHIGVPTVLDVYLFNGILPLVVSGLLLKRAARIYFGVSRTSGTAKAA